jgi:peptidoglycan/LPS O-acetylase OafA/YrhL
MTTRKLGSRTRDVKSQKNQEIERLRAIAVIMVVFAHVTPPIADWAAIFRHPRTGVDIFFVISGFVVSRSLLRQLPDLRDAKDIGEAFTRSLGCLKAFYTRRFFRIFPLAIATMAFQYVLHVFGTPVGGDFNGFWREVFAIFSGVYNYSMPEEGYSQFGVYWSLSIEEHFYLLLPLAFLFCRTRARRIGLSIAGIALVAFVLRTFLGTAPAGWAYPEYYQLMSSHLRFDALLAGVAAALLFEEPPSKPFLPPALLRWGILPSCVALIWAMPRALPGQTYFHQGFTAAWLLSAVLVTYASFAKGYVFEIPVLRRVLERIGARSYAVYLLHIPVQRLSDAIAAYWPAYSGWKSANPGLHWPVYFAAVLLFAEFSWWALEAPMQNLGRRLIDAEGVPTIPKHVYAIAAGAIMISAALCYHHDISKHFGRLNLALGKSTTLSSVLDSRYPPEALANGELESMACANAQPSEAPWATIDLGAEHDVSKIVIYNRWDGWQDDSLPIILEVCQDKAVCKTVDVRRGVFSRLFPWKAKFKPEAARYVRIKGKPSKYLCLTEVEVFGT